MENEVLMAILKILKEYEKMECFSSLNDEEEERLNEALKAISESKNPVNPLQLKLVPREGYELCWIESIKLCPRGCIIADKLQPSGPLQLPGTHWKSVSDNKYPELLEYWTFSTFTPNSDVAAICHYEYKDLILCERPIKYREAEQKEYNDNLQSFKKFICSEEGSSMYRDLDSVLSHPLVKDVKDKKLLEMLDNVDKTLEPLMENIDTLVHQYDKEVNKLKLLDRNMEKEIGRKVLEEFNKGCDPKKGINAQDLIDLLTDNIDYEDYDAPYPPVVVKVNNSPDCGNTGYFYIDSVEYDKYKECLVIKVVE